MDEISPIIYKVILEIFSGEFNLDDFKYELTNKEGIKQKFIFTPTI